MAASFITFFDRTGEFTEHDIKEFEFSLDHLSEYQFKLTQECYDPNIDIKSYQFLDLYLGNDCVYYSDDLEALLETLYKDNLISKASLKNIKIYDTGSYYWAFKKNNKVKGN